MSKRQINWISGDWGSRFSVFHQDCDLISFWKYGTASEMGFIHSPPALALQSKYSNTKRLNRKYSGLPKFLKDEIKMTLFIRSLVIPDIFSQPPPVSYSITVLPPFLNMPLNHLEITSQVTKAMSSRGNGTSLVTLNSFHKLKWHFVNYIWWIFLPHLRNIMGAPAHRTSVVLFPASQRNLKSSPLWVDAHKFVFYGI